jgi:ATP-dependent Zn protease
VFGGTAAKLSAVEVEAGVKRLMGDAERRARSILGARREILQRLAEFLLEHGTLSDGRISDMLNAGN